MISQIQVINRVQTTIHFLLFQLADGQTFMLQLLERGVDFHQFNENEQFDGRYIITQNYQNINNRLTIQYIEREILPISQRYNQILYNSQDFVNDVIMKLEEKLNIRLELVDDPTQILPVLLFVLVGKLKYKSLLFLSLLIFLTGQGNGSGPNFNLETFKRSMTNLKKFTWRYAQKILN